MIERKKVDCIRELTNVEKQLQEHGMVDNRFAHSGSICHDRSSTGTRKNGQKYFHDRWVGEFQVGDVKFRYKNRDRMAVEEWVKAVRSGRIRPWDNKADWLLMEQKKDLEAQYGEKICYAAEESYLMFMYHNDHDLEPIKQYMTHRLMPHLTYYSCHTLHMGQDSALASVKHCIALLLTEITAGKPVTNFTKAAKRMMRVRKSHGNFWYYEKAPRDVKLIVDGIDYKPLAEIYQLTRDNRI